MHYQQHIAHARLNRRKAQRMPTLLAAFVDVIQPEHAVRITKDCQRELEADAVVLALVEEILSLIPLVAHLYIQIVSRKSRLGRVTRIAENIPQQAHT